MLFICVIALMSFKNINTHSVHAIAQEEIMENNIETMSLMGGDTSGDVYLIEEKRTA